MGTPDFAVVQNLVHDLLAVRKIGSGKEVH